MIEGHAIAVIRSVLEFAGMATRLCGGRLSAMTRCGFVQLPDLAGEAGVGTLHFIGRAARPAASQGLRPALDLPLRQGRPLRQPQHPVQLPEALRLAAQARRRRQADCCRTRP
jgi:hypothetical protein